MVVAAILAIVMYAVGVYEVNQKHYIWATWFGMLFVVNSLSFLKAADLI